MFTGIVESFGKIVRLEKEYSNLHVWVETNFISEIKIDQSIAHNGICLTVDKIENQSYRLTAIQETIEKTTIGKWKKNDIVNLERCVKLGDRIDGHIVQGHIDTQAVCIDKIDKSGSMEFVFEYPRQYADLIIEKGSIAIDGISLTCYNLSENRFYVSIIPYTIEHTNARNWVIGREVNIEFDILGKYLKRSREVVIS